MFISIYEIIKIMKNLGKLGIVLHLFQLILKLIMIFIKKCVFIKLEIISLF
jgi:hypothetical protein